MGAHRKSGNADVWVSNIADHGTAGQGDDRVDLVLHLGEGDGWDNKIFVCVDIARLHPGETTMEIADNLMVERWG